ncbi:MAG: ADP-ribosylglycohydrolase family protein [Chitinophagaceae bacterium]|nr:ADP-ribosylglycohydrolase family protein [Chitinophagaceae bacterium]
MNYTINPIHSALFGLAIGDALGVPVEFQSREEIAENPVCDMLGYGTYHLPPGTWSDDSSLAFCLAEALTQKFSLQQIAQYFMDWYYKNYWTPLGSVFDIGIATREAIHRLSQGVDPVLAGGSDEYSNGNGSLMRILPLLFYIRHKPIAERFEITRQVSAITHGHIRAAMSCFYYLEFARELLTEKNPKTIYQTLQQSLPSFFTEQGIPSSEIALFNRLLQQDISTLPESSIQSFGYVLHTLEAVIWCLLTTTSYAEAVLKAVNLGSDTDTTACVTGGLAGLLYGLDTIPPHWLNQLARKEDIAHLADRMQSRLG